MNLEQIKALDRENYLNTYGERAEVAFESGKGLELFSQDGRVFKDFLGGIAVNALGHAHPVLTKALHNQIDKVLHTSNLYYIENQAKLAKKLTDSTFADRVFFASTGAEANEGAIKLAKIYHYKKGTGKFGVVSLDKSFHGRTIATVAATGQEKYQKPYRPLPDGFSQVKANDFDALSEAVSDTTCAILLEPVQGESGVRPLDREYLEKVRRLCDERDIVLIFDEVQTGMGRCGSLFCYMQTGVVPDILTSAKALGGGVPIGAVLAKEKFSAFAPGDHGTTFGGNPLATAAGLAVFEAFEKENIVENAKAMGEYFKAELQKLKESSDGKITEIRGAGLLIGIEMKEEIAKAVFCKMFDAGYLTSLCAGDTMRVAPPLIITKTDIDEFIDTLKGVLKEV